MNNRGLTPAALTLEMLLPHIFQNWALVEGRIRAAPKVLLMLDFDGTLSPIVAHPDLAEIPAGTRAVLERLGALEDVKLALISGRAAADVRSKMGLDGIEYVGNHGRERIRPGSAEVEFDPTFRAVVERACGEFKSNFAAVEGFWVEDKGLTAALHYRAVAQERHGEVRAAVGRVAERFADRLKVSEGKRVFDVAPKDGKDKGVSVKELLAEQGGIEAVLAVYLGDDTTDEAAFLALPAEALKVYVGEQARPTAADWRLRNPEEVGEFLERVALICGQAVQPVLPVD